MELLLINHVLHASCFAKCITCVISLDLHGSSRRWVLISQMGTREAWKMVSNLPEATEFISRRSRGLRPRQWSQSAHHDHSKTQVGDFLKAPRSPLLPK